MATSYYAALLAATFPVVTPNEPVGSMDGASGRSAVFGQRRDPFGERAGVAQIARIGMHGVQRLVRSALPAAIDLHRHRDAGKAARQLVLQLGRASCRERVSQNV